MIVRDISFKTAEENIFYDSVLLESAEDGASGEVLRFWEAKKFFVVLGRTSRLEDDVKVKAANKDRIEIVRRPSGGGTVLQGPGCLNYSLVLSYGRDPLLKDIRKSYGFILNRICAALSRLGVNAVFKPISDITLCGKKFSGNAQSRKRKYLLHHGTALYVFPIGMVERYLEMPKKQPPYRDGRSHDDFLTNINIAPRDIKEAITSEFIGVTGEQDRTYTGTGEKTS